MRSLLCGRYPLALRSLCADVPGLLCAACSLDAPQQASRGGDALGHRALSRCSDSASNPCAAQDVDGGAA